MVRVRTGMMRYSVRPAASEQRIEKRKAIRIEISERVEWCYFELVIEPLHRVSLIDGPAAFDCNSSNCMRVNCG